MWSYLSYFLAVFKTLSSCFPKTPIFSGLQPASAVCIMGFNAPEWFIADIGSIMAGGIAAGIYTTNSAESCKYILSHSKAQFIVVENRAMLDKILQVTFELVCWTDCITAFRMLFIFIFIFHTLFSG